MSIDPSLLERRGGPSSHGRAAETQHEVEFVGLGRSFARPTGGPTADGSRHVVLRDITLSVRPGEVVAILGTSGCGKSTLLRITAGLDAPTTGEVRIGGDLVVGIDPRCAFAFQEPRLLPWRTLAGNIALGLPGPTTAADRP